MKLANFENVIRNKRNEFVLLFMVDKRKCYFAGQIN